MGNDAMKVERSRGGRRRALVAVLAVALTGAMAAEAGATVRVENHTDPAGDRTPFSYTLSGSPNTGGQIAPRTVSLVDDDYQGFGVTPGVYTIQANPPAGWRVAAIQCTDQVLGAADFQIDLANARVQVDHSRATADTHHVCAFTNRRIGAAGSAAGSGSGIAPTPLVTGNTPRRLPTRAALVGVRGRRGHAIATLRLARRSVVRASLLKGSRVVATRRVVRAAGQHRVQVTLPSAERRRLRAGEPGERVTDQHDRRHSALLDLDQVVETPRRARPSGGAGEDDGAAAPGQVRVDLRRRGARGRRLGVTHHAGEPHARGDALGDHVEEQLRVGLAVAEQPERDPLERRQRRAAGAAREPAGLGGDVDPAIHRAGRPERPARRRRPRSAAVA
jgi:hypothetical protein